MGPRRQPELIVAAPGPQHQAPVAAIGAEPQAIGLGAQLHLVARARGQQQAAVLHGPLQQGTVAAGPQIKARIDDGPIDQQAVVTGAGPHRAAIQGHRLQLPVGPLGSVDRQIAADLDGVVATGQLNRAVAHRPIAELHLPAAGIQAGRQPQVGLGRQPQQAIATGVEHPAALQGRQIKQQLGPSPVGTHLGPLEPFVDPQLGQAIARPQQQGAVQQPQVLLLEQQRGRAPGAAAQGPQAVLRHHLHQRQRRRPQIDPRAVDRHLAAALLQAGCADGGAGHQRVIDPQQHQQGRWRCGTGGQSGQSGTSPPGGQPQGLGAQGRGGGQLRRQRQIGVRPGGPGEPALAARHRRTAIAQWGQRLQW